MKLPPSHIPEGAPKHASFAGFGQRMLERLGWEKGQGLGRDGSGITEAFRVRKKEDTVGVRALCGSLLMMVGLGTADCGEAPVCMPLSMFGLFVGGMLVGWKSGRLGLGRQVLGTGF